MDELVYDIMPMDCTNILVGIPFLHDRKAHIIPYQEKCIVTKGDESFVIHLAPIPRATSLLVNKAQAKCLVQASHKFVLIMIQGHHESLLETKTDSGSAIVDGAMDGQFTHLLHEFEDVFRSRIGFSLERAITHGIDFELGASLPISGLYRKSVRDDEKLSSFLELATSYRRFVRGFLEIVHSFHQITQAMRAFEWGTYQ